MILTALTSVSQKTHKPQKTRHNHTALSINSITSHVRRKHATFVIFILNIFRYYDRHKPPSVYFTVSNCIKCILMK